MKRKILFTAVGLLAAVAIVSAAVSAQRAQRAAPAPAAVGQGRLPPIPYESFPAVRPPDIIKSVYEFAAYHPEVLSYIPCYCGCEGLGHKGNHDCFVKSRDAGGRVVAFESHATGCTICIDVARDAMQMFNAGASVREIRSAIDLKWGARFPSHTPTPNPPKGE